MLRIFLCLDIVQAASVEETINMFKFVFFLIVSSVGASHYTTEVADNFQSFRPVGRFQKHVGEAHFGVTLNFDIFEERVCALKLTEHPM